MGQQLVLQILRKVAELSVEGVVKQNGPGHEHIMTFKPYAFKSIILIALTESHTPPAHVVPLGLRPRGP